MKKQLPYITRTPGKSMSYMTEGSAGMDLCSLEHKTILPRTVELVNTGLKVAIPKGYAGLLLPRSSLGLKKGLMLMNSVGLIDSDYRGEIMCMFYNTRSEMVTITPEERVAQLVVVPVLTLDWVVVDDLDSTERGEGGFGSTGGYQS